MTRFPHDGIPERDYDVGDAAEPALPADPQFDAWIARLAPAIDAPNATPRDDMWEAIQATQRAQRAAARGAVPGVRALHRRWRVPAAVAAALLLGIAIDRVATRSPDPSLPQGPSRIAAGPMVVPRTDSAPRAGRETVEEGIGGGRNDSGAAARSTTDVPRRIAANVPAAPSPTRPSSADSADVSHLYRLAAVQTLTQAEALLTSYRATDLVARNPTAARQLGGWGREVLSSTRLLIDSPAGRDPQLRPLLEDLELVLVQIVRLSGAPLDASDRALIDRALRDRDLLPRIRTAVPAGAAGTTSDE